jgi:hypothetical protein
MFAISRAQHAFRHRGEFANGLVAIIETCLRIESESGILRSGVPGIGTDYRETLRQGAGERTTATGWSGCGHYVAIDAAVGLVKKAAVPVQRQTHFEANGIGLAIDGAHPLEHLAR